MNEAYTSSGLATHLYAGVFPTVPIKNNDHALGGDCAPKCEYAKTFEDYGQLFDAMRGRQWVLGTAKPAEVTSGNALGNLFVIPDGSYIAVVAFAPLVGQVSLTVRGFSLSCGQPQIQYLVPRNQSPVQGNITSTVASGEACDGGWGGGDVTCMSLALYFGGTELEPSRNATSSIVLVRFGC